MLSANVRPGPVHLTVADLDRSLDYYGSEIGLSVVARNGASAELGTVERTLLVLTEEPGAAPADGYTGLYHFALLVPERVDLARWLAHAARDRVALTGMSDHAVSEALYLRDPDHHGIEIYCDRPREQWEGRVAELMTTVPLDVNGLLGELEDPATASFGGLAEGTVMGHVHLRVSDVDATVRFYRDVLGLELMAQLGPQAAFLAAGGYHHHLGSNTWESRGAGPAPAGSATLRHYTLLVPDQGERDAAVQRLEQAGHAIESTDGGPLVRDPSGNALVLAS